MSGYQPGQEVAGRFVIEGRLATGGMAEIYAAEMRLARGVRRPVVLKRVHPHLARDPEFIAMFVDEARIASQLSHPGVVPVLDALDDGQDLLLVLEHVPGWDLAAVLTEARAGSVPFPIEAAVHIGRELAATLAYCHEARAADGRPLKLVHRDVTPSNVLVARDGSVRLLDFGVAKAALRATRTATRTLKGKVPYMAPEQLRGRPVDARADLYALGLILFEALAGRRAIDADDEVAALEQAREPQHPPIATLRTDVPPPLASLVERLLSTDPEARPARAADVAAELEALLPPGDGGAAAMRALVQSVLGRPDRPPETGRSAVDQALARLAERDSAGGGGTVRRTPRGGWGGAATPAETAGDVGPAGHAVPETVVRSLLADPPLGGAVPLTVVRNDVIDPRPVLPAKRRPPVAAFVLAAVVAIAAGGWAVSAYLRAEAPDERRPPAVDTTPAGVGETGFVRVVTVPPGARIRIGDELTPDETPAVLELAVGTHRVSLELADHLEASEEVVVVARRSVSVERTLERRPGTLTVESRPPGAAVTVAGERRGDTPLVLEHLPRQQLAVRVVHPGPYAPYETEVDLAANATARVDARLVRQIPMGELWINSDVQRARVTVDGRTVSQVLPWRGRVPAGAHRIVVTDAEGRSAQRTVQVRDGETARAGLFLR